MGKIARSDSISAVRDAIAAGSFRSCRVVASSSASRRRRGMMFCAWFTRRPHCIRRAIRFLHIHKILAYSYLCRNNYCGIVDGHREDDRKVHILHEMTNDVHDSRGCFSGHCDARPRSRECPLGEPMVDSMERNPHTPRRCIVHRQRRSLVSLCASPGVLYTTSPHPKILRNSQRKRHRFLSACAPRKASLVRASRVFRQSFRTPPKDDRCSS